MRAYPSGEKRASGERRLQDLAERIKKARDAYYNHDSPIISDQQYDALEKDYQTFCDAYPEFAQGAKALETVGISVGSPVGKRFPQIIHHKPMLSLRNAFHKNAVRDFIKNMQTFLNMPPDASMPKMLLEPKIDGLSLSLHYHRGKLTGGSTRGNGRIGEDITANARTILDIPHQLEGGSFPEDMTIRGEVYMTHEAFLQLNRQQQEDTSFTTSRHAAAASLRLKDSTITATRPLCFYAYGALYQGRDSANQTFSNLRRQMTQWGFPVVPLLGEAVSVEEIEHYYRCARRMKTSYDADGIVCKIDSLALQKRLGDAPTSPRWALAYKFPSQRVSACVGRIDIQIGRTGQLTPLAQLLEPVTIDGIRIQRVVLSGFHHGGKQKALALGDRIDVELVGGAIPQVYRVIEADKASSPMALSRCPSCGAVLDRHLVEKPSQDETFVKCLLFCRQGESCPEQFVAMMRHFVGRDGMDIKGLGEETIYELITQGLLREPADLFTLKKRAEKNPPKGWLLSKKSSLLPEFEGVFSKRITALFTSIDAQRSVEMARLLFAFGIPHVGLSSCRAIATLLPRKEEVWQLTQNMHCARSWTHGLEGMKDNYLSERVIKALEHFFANKRHFDMFKSVLHEVTPHVQKQSSLAGKSVLFAPHLTMSLREARALARRRRMTVLTKKTLQKNNPDYVVYAKGHEPEENTFSQSTHFLHEKQWIKMS